MEASLPVDVLIISQSQYGGGVVRTCVDCVMLQKQHLIGCGVIKSFLSKRQVCSKLFMSA